MVLECCQLCGIHSSKFTCQTCINSGNFWIGKAQFSFSGKKQIVSNLKAENDDLRKILSNVYKSSLSYKESIKTSLSCENRERIERIQNLRLETVQLEDRIGTLRLCNVQREKDIFEKQTKIESFKQQIKSAEQCCLVEKAKISSVKTHLQVECRSIIRQINTIFSISPNNVLGIPFRECKSLKDYVRQIRIDEGEAENTSVVLSHLIQFTSVLASTFSVQLPFPNLSLRLTLPRRLLLKSLQQLDCNVLYLCLSQHFRRGSCPLRRVA